MSCGEWEAILVEVARGRAVEAAWKDAALLHARNCPQCAGRLREEQEVTAALRELGAAGVAYETPSRVEAVLRSAFRERPAFSRVIWSAAVAAAALAIVMMTARPTPPQPETEGVEFYLLRYGNDFDAVSPVVRMNVPRAVLASYGLPIDPGMGGDTVSAEVVLASDGTARAIRFVR
jgi:hypothetical protein